MKKNADIKLGYECNDHCTHCVVEELRDLAIKQKNRRTTQDYKDEVLKSKNAGFKSITITGGEPTIRPDFLEIVKFVYQNNLSIELQSNGRNFKDKSLAQDSSKYINTFIIALHGPNEKIHDKITQTKGSFEETIDGIKNLVKFNAKITGKIVISKINYKYILETLKLYEKLGVKVVVVSFPHSSGAKDYIKKIAPYYTQIKSQIQDSLEYYSDINKLLLILEEILPCALDKEYPLIHFYEFFENLRISQLNTLSDKTRNWRILRKAIKRKGEICPECLLNNFCDGYWKEYINERGFQEFKPIKKLDKKIFFKHDIKKIENYFEK
ncbi:MAG: radical SAM protein [Nanoarchaeota archaeon]|nr:radical SAM protein [Nanoarchaeota archaeon]